MKKSVVVRKLVNDARESIERTAEVGGYKVNTYQLTNLPTKNGAKLTICATNAAGETKDLNIFFPRLIDMPLSQADQQECQELLTIIPARITLLFQLPDNLAEVAKRHEMSEEALAHLYSASLASPIIVTNCGRGLIIVNAQIFELDETRFVMLKTAFFSIRAFPLLPEDMQQLVKLLPQEGQHAIIDADLPAYGDIDFDRVPVQLTGPINMLYSLR